MKTLFCILTCNRFFYLRNCVDSILEFVPLKDIEIMIVDNNTIENGIDDYFNSIKDRVKIHRFYDRVPNELYRAMNFGIKYCFENKIDIINFIQDDYQFLYRRDSLLDEIRACFSENKKIGQINCNMAWRRKKVKDYSVIRSKGINFAILNSKNLVDNGFTRVSLYKKTGLYPSGMVSYDQDSHKTFGFGKNRYKKNPNGELWFGGRCRKLGYMRAISLMPNQAMVFDCSYVRKWDRFGKYFPPPNKYYLKPLSEEKIKEVRNKHDKKKFCFIENMAIPWGWIPTTYDKHNHENIMVSIK